MGKVILICGKICSGKSFYARKLAGSLNAVVLSCDEISADIFHHSEGERFDEIAADIKAYLHKLAVRIAATGTTVILDWGFWGEAERRQVADHYRKYDIDTEWHYIDIPDEEWRRNIKQRNDAVKAGLSDDFYVDDGLLDKLERNFEYPKPSDMGFWLKFVRE